MQKQTHVILVGEDVRSFVGELQVLADILVYSLAMK